MLILFTLDGTTREVKLPLRIEDNWTLKRALEHVRLQLRTDSSIELRAVSDKGVPLDVELSVRKILENRLAASSNKKAGVDTTVTADGGNEQATTSSSSNVGTSNVLDVYVLLEGSPRFVNRTLLAALQVRKTATTKYHAGQQADIVTPTSSGFDPTGIVDGDSDDSDEDEATRVNGGGDGGGSGPAGLEDDPQYGQTSTSENLNRAPGLHVIKVNGSYQKAYAVGNVAWGGAVVSELPHITVLYPSQMAEMVRSNEKLRTRTYDPSYEAGPSALQGVDDEDFNKYVSIARTYGHLVNSKDKFGTQVALYPELSSIRHSCYPNCIQRRALTRPYRAVIRCCNPNGLAGGEEVTILYPKVNTVLFLLMPKERRQKAIQERYHYTCDCARCWKSNDEKELSLSGAYFHESIENNNVQQKRLTIDMRDEFEALNVIDSRPGGAVDTPAASRIPVAPGKLLDFVEKYTAADAPLRLHKHHWRLSCVRRAYMKQADFVLSAQQNSANRKVTPLRSIIEKRSIDVVLQQMSTENAFIPPGHPFYVTSESLFRKILAVLPDKLCAAVQSKARKLQVDWTFLATAQLLWGVKVTPIRPSSAASTTDSTAYTTPGAEDGDASDASADGDANTTTNTTTTAKKAASVGTISKSASMTGTPNTPTADAAATAESPPSSAAVQDDAAPSQAA